MDVNEFRLERGWSFDYLAEKSGVSKNSWIKLSKGGDVRPMTKRKMLDFMQENGYVASGKERTYTVLYQRGPYENLDETTFSDFRKARLFCDAQAQEIKPGDVKNGAFCIVTDDYDAETGEYRTTLYDAIDERRRWKEELDRERDEEEAQE
jgi:hypothetical protein